MRRPFAASCLPWVWCDLRKLSSNRPLGTSLGRIHPQLRILSSWRCEARRLGQTKHGALSLESSVYLPSRDKAPTTTDQFLFPGQNSAPRSPSTPRHIRRLGPLHLANVSKRIHGYRPFGLGLDTPVAGGTFPVLSAFFFLLWIFSIFPESRPWKAGICHLRPLRPLCPQSRPSRLC